MGRTLPVLLAILLVPGTTLGQALHGQILDAESASPMPGAHVFVDGTNLGDVSGDDGSFSLVLPETRPLVVVVSMVGFRLQTITVDARSDLSEPREIQLHADPVSLGEFVVEAIRPRALRRLRGRMEDLLFSSTAAGSRCEIENPEVLRVSQEENSVHVVSRGPVHVRNPYLGYRITIHGLTLDGNQRQYAFTGRLQFEELPAEDERAQRSVVDRRERVYRGSRQHFLRALVEDQVRQAGFVAELVSSAGTTSGAEEILEMSGDTRTGATRVLFGEQGNLSRTLIFDGALLVSWSREPPPPGYSSFLRSINVPEPNTRDRRSWLILPQGIALLDRNGTPFTDGPVAPIAHFGFWSWQRVCDTLPNDWVPEGGVRG